MPSFPIVDSHVHLYDPARIAYPWLASVPAIGTAHLPADFERERGSVAVERLVFVEVDAASGREHDEALFVDALAGIEPRIGAIVASAPVETGDRVAADLEALRAIPRVKGVRRLIQSHADPDYCLSQGFVEGVRTVGRFGLTFDLCIGHRQLASAVELVRRCPDVSFVLDHIAKPPIAAGGREVWAGGMRAMAALPNVVVKISGVVTEADHRAWTIDHVRPYIDHTIACFGFSRVLFGSDWPVLNLATTYAAWVALMDDILQGVGHDDLQRFFRTNAKRTYSFVDA
jgi:L-fuconolactonase